MIVRFVKGFVIGASMLIPGVSGGTMAIILGVYDELISAVSNILKAFLRNFFFLITYAAGGVVGIVLLSGPLLRLVTRFPIPSMYFFMGAIAAGIWPLYGRAMRPVGSKRPDIIFENRIIASSVRRERLRFVNVCAAAVGAAVGVGLEFLPAGLIPSPDRLDFAAFVILFFAGIVIAVALILPGISGSYMLLVFGMYDLTLRAIGDLDVPYLAPLVLGGLAGTFGTAKGIENLMRKRPQFIFMLIIGFMIGSLVQVFPGLPSGIGWVIAPVALIAGFSVIFFLIAYRGKDDGHAG
ncbi:MAG: DUF368 domain-containing protein [Clostridiales Family XIII bacterium]|nr:DUF368 domain-containing protein [Clostridiales Family XIII bacterium]